MLVERWLLNTLWAHYKWVCTVSHASCSTYHVECRATTTRKKLDKCKRDVWRNQEGKALKRFISISIYVMLLLVMLDKKRISSSTTQEVKKHVIVTNSVAFGIYLWEFSAGIALLLYPFSTQKLRKASFKNYFSFVFGLDWFNFDCEQVHIVDCEVLSFRNL